ncbi:DUF397 domain-containing protein [Nocardiopsis sp. CT-R113]|uniref:DUF397 domain-containing protein n=1 Tax=Nocardiopsis codii TaxID=3065942 RepID=A0ABU7KAE1_9ACTN|nr:DUF397 domain-containing protein [Nocardiopsis sp. CT-R113]MEE2038977.1 DUF397 domain-containing protein [Nocardiopsis sp. CT-R113]
MQNLSWRKPSGSRGGRQNRVEVAELPTSSAVRESQPPTTRIWPSPSSGRPSSARWRVNAAEPPTPRRPSELLPGADVCPACRTNVPRRVPGDDPGTRRSGVSCVFRRRRCPVAS